jgi:DNA-binding MarR family transcriptional regulator
LSTKIVSRQRNPLIKSKPQVDSTAELGRLLRRASRAATKVYRSRVKELELTHRQAAAVLALVEQPGATLSNLADAVGADQATASALIDRLLAADLVRRETNPADRRRAMLYPTEKALQLAQALAGARLASEDRIRAVLGNAGSDRLAKLLVRLVNGLEAHPISVANGAHRS